MSRSTPVSALACLLASLALLLTGCYTSSRPKFPPNTAVAALGDGGRYVAYERMSDGSFKREDAFDVRKRADGGYDFVDSKGTVTKVSFHAAGSDRFAVQVVEGDGVHYAVVQVRGNEALAFATDCSKQDAAKLQAQGVVVRQLECMIDRVNDPAALFAGLELGEPSSKLVRE
jgi:hypothetical protein